MDVTVRVENRRLRLRTASSMCTHAYAAIIPSGRGLHAHAPYMLCSEDDFKLGTTGRAATVSMSRLNKAWEGKDEKVVRRIQIRIATIIFLCHHTSPSSLHLTCCFGMFLQVARLRFVKLSKVREKWEMKLYERSCTMTGPCLFVPSAGRPIRSASLLKSREWEEWSWKMMMMNDDEDGCALLKYFKAHTHPFLSLRLLFYKRTMIIPFHHIHPIHPIRHAHTLTPSHPHTLSHTPAIHRGITSAVCINRAVDELGWVYQRHSQPFPIHQNPVSF